MFLKETLIYTANQDVQLSLKTRADFCPITLLQLKLEKTRCIFQMNMSRTTKKRMRVGEVKPRAKVLRNFSVKVVQELSSFRVV